MARAQVYVKPSMRQLEVYQDFIGGLNTETSNENLRDNEFVVFENVDLYRRGSVKRRNGWTPINISDLPTGKAQGIFYFPKSDGTKERLIAVNGKLYRDDNGTAQEITITGLESGFQTSRPISAVLFRGTMFIATGTKLVEYDGTTAKVVEPHKPTPMEYTYVGTNALADDPLTWVQTVEESSTIDVTGMVFDRPQGILKQPVTITGCVKKPQSDTVEYRFEIYEQEQTSPKFTRDWSTTNTYTWTPSTSGVHLVVLKVRKKGTTTPEYSVAMAYTVSAVDTLKDKNLQASTIHNCNIIFVHYNRLMMTGDPDQPTVIYVSDLNNPRYFPMLNTLNFQTGRKDEITAVVPYRDDLIVFTKSSIQLLSGRSPEDYQRKMIHSYLGCIAPKSAQVIGNHIAFLSQEGLYILKSTILGNDQLNVERIDTNIRSEVHRDTDACAINYDNRYMICFPQRKKVLKFYYANGAWVKDVSNKLDMEVFHIEDETLYGQRADGSLVFLDQNAYKDGDEVFVARIASKQFDLGLPYHQKRLRYLYLLTRNNALQVNLKVTVRADGAAVLTPDISHAVVQNGQVVWIDGTAPNVTYNVGTILGQWVLGEDPLGIVELLFKRVRVMGKCRRVQVDIVHDEDAPCEIFGFGIEFKPRRL